MDTILEQNIFPNFRLKTFKGSVFEKNRNKCSAKKVILANLIK